MKQNDFTVLVQSIFNLEFFYPTSITAEDGEVTLSGTHERDLGREMGSSSIPAGTQQGGLSRKSKAGERLPQGGLWIDTRGN